MARKKNCNKCSKPKSLCNCGRPIAIDEEVLRKLEHAFAHSCTDKEACVYAGIAPSTLYKFQKENPEFIDRKEQLKVTPNLKARTTIIENLHNIDTAKWWSERKMKDEFSQRTELSTDVTINFDSAFTPEKKEE